MNNFFLRPWARGPVFSGGDEGGGGGDDNDNAAANREASTGGGAPVDPFARSARTKARISTGRQDNMNNRFAGVNNTVTTPNIYDNDNNQYDNIPSYGSVPPGTGSGIDYTGSIPPAGEGGSSRILDGVITGNDDPDFYLAPTFQTLDRVIDPGRAIQTGTSDGLLGAGRETGIIPGDVGPPENNEMDLSPGVLTSLGNMLVGPAGGATAESRRDNILNTPVKNEGILSGFQDFAGDLYTGTKDLGKDFVNRTFFPFNNAKDQMQEAVRAKAALEGPQYSMFGNKYDTVGDVATADKILLEQSRLANRDQAAGRTRDYGLGIPTSTNYGYTLKPISAIPGYADMSTVEKAAARYTPSFDGIDPQTNLPYFIEGADYNSRLSGNLGGDNVREEGRGETLSQKMANTRGGLKSFLNSPTANDPVYGVGGRMGPEVVGSMVPRPLKTITLPSGETTQVFDGYQPESYGTADALIDMGTDTLLGNTAGMMGGIADEFSANQLPSGALLDYNKDQNDLALRKFNANLTPEQQARLQGTILGEDGGGMAALRDKALSAFPSLAGAVGASALTKGPSGAMLFGGLTYGGESKGEKDKKLAEVARLGLLDDQPQFKAFYEKTGNREIALEMMKKDVNSQSVLQDLTVGALSGMISDRIFKGKLIPKGTGSAITTALGKAPVVGTIAKAAGTGINTALNKASGVLNPVISKVGSKIPANLQTILNKTRGAAANTVANVSGRPTTAFLREAAKRAAQNFAAEFTQEGYMETIATQRALDRALAMEQQFQMADAPSKVDQGLVGGLLSIGGGGPSTINSALAAARAAKDGLGTAQPVGTVSTNNTNNNNNQIFGPNQPGASNIYGPNLGTSNIFQGPLEDGTTDMRGVLDRARGNFGTNNQSLEDTTTDVSGILSGRGNFGTNNNNIEASLAPYANRRDNFGTNNNNIEESLNFYAPGRANFGTNNQVIEDTVDMSGVLPRRGNFSTNNQVIESTTGADMSGLLGQRGNFSTNNQVIENTAINPLTGQRDNFGTNNQVIEDTSINPLTGQRDNFGTNNQELERTPGELILSQAQKGPLKSGAEVQAEAVANVTPADEFVGLETFTSEAVNDIASKKIGPFSRDGNEKAKNIEQNVGPEASKAYLDTFMAESQKILDARNFQGEQPIVAPVSDATTLDNIKVMDVINEEVLRTGGLSLSTARQLEANTPFTMVQINEMVAQVTNPAANPLETSGNLSFVEQIGPMPFVNRGMNPSTTQLENNQLLGEFEQAKANFAANKPSTTQFGPANMTRTQLENNQLLGEFEQARADFAANNATNTSADTGLIGPLPMFGPANQTNTSVDTGIIGPMPMFGPANQTNTSGSTVTNNNMTNLETTNTNPYIDTTVVPPPEDTGPVPATPVGSLGEGDSDDVTTPPDDNGNCPPGYILKFINGMYICVPIEEEVEEEEEEEEEVVTYGRPRAGSYYQPRTVGPISPYILNSDEV